MYSFRFVLHSSSQNNNNNFYYKLLTKDCKEFIDNNYIIGTVPYSNLFLNSYYNINYYMNIQNKKDVGFYVCTCGLYYTLGDCTCPSIIGECNECKRKIGGTGHKLIGPEEGQTSHFRIIRNEEDKNLNNWVKEAINDGRIPYKLFDDYKKEILYNHLNKQPKGIQDEGAANFIERNNYIIIPIYCSVII